MPSKSKKSTNGFRLETNKPSILKTIFTSIKDLVQDINIQITSHGLYVTSPDISQVSLLFLLMRKDFFDAYERDTDTTIGVHIDSFMLLLNDATKENTMEIQGSNKDDKIHIKFWNKGEALFLYVLYSYEAYVLVDEYSEYDMSVLTLEQISYTIDPQDYPVYIRMKSSKFGKLCSKWLKYGDVVTLDVIPGDEERLEYRVKGSVVDLNGTLFPVSRLDEHDIKHDEFGIHMLVKKAIRLSFSTKYLAMFSKIASLSQNVYLGLTGESAMLIEYEYEGTVMIRYYLAPKLENE